MSYNYVKGIERSERRTTDNTIIKEEKGTIGLLCPICDHIHYIKINTSLETEFSDCDISTGSNYFGICPNCSEDVLFEEIDVNMGPIIEILNSKGYRTSFCCEGHIKEYIGFQSPDFAYIAFAYPSQAIICKDYPLPSTWYLDKTNTGRFAFTIRETIFINIKALYSEGPVNRKTELEYVLNHRDHEKMMIDLYNWADSLPTVEEVGLEFIKTQEVNND